jgi:hypothetical protein
LAATAVATASRLTFRGCRQSQCAIRAGLEYPIDLQGRGSVNLEIYPLPSTNFRGRPMSGLLSPSIKPLTHAVTRTIPAWLAKMKQVSDGWTQRLFWLKQRVFDNSYAGMLISAAPLRVQLRGFHRRVQTGAAGSSGYVLAACPSPARPVCFLSFIMHTYKPQLPPARFIRRPLPRALEQCALNFMRSSRDNRTRVLFINSALLTHGSA